MNVTVDVNNILHNLGNVSYIARTGLLLEIFFDSYSKKHTYASEGAANAALEAIDGALDGVDAVWHSIGDTRYNVSKVGVISKVDDIREAQNSEAYQLLIFFNGADRKLKYNTAALRDAAYVAIRDAALAAQDADEAIDFIETVDGNHVVNLASVYTSEKVGNDSISMRIGNIERIMNFGDAVARDAEFSAIAADAATSEQRAPEAINVAITGTAQDGQVLTLGYQFRDSDVGDSEDVSTAVWFIADDAQGTNKAQLQADANPFQYTVVVGDIGKFIWAEVTPVSDSAVNNVGKAVAAAMVGPVIA